MEDIVQSAGMAAQSILAPAAGWGQQVRQLLARSNASALLANGAEESEVAEAVKPMIADLRAAIAGYQAETVPLSQLPDGVLESVISQEIGGFVRLTGGGWMPEHRQEFIDQCCVEFAALPATVIIPAIRQARRKVFDPKRFVSWVFEYVEKDINRLDIEGKQLAELARIAGI